MKISIGAVAVMGVCAVACGAEGPATTDGPGRATATATATWEPEVFPISYWWGPPKQFNTRERYQEIADAGFTYAMRGAEGGGTPEENKLTLDHCQAVGIKAFLWDNRVPHAIGGDARVKSRRFPHPLGLPVGTRFPRAGASGARATQVDRAAVVA